MKITLDNENLLEIYEKRRDKQEGRVGGVKGWGDEWLPSEYE